MQKYSLDEKFFSNVNSEEKAYWLGFIWADGSISQTAPKCSGKNRLQIFLKEDDACILEDFKRDINYNGPIHHKKYKTSFAKDKKNICYIHINSRKICMDLESLGFTLKENRTIPAIKSDMIRHFIRGFFDGDGCMSVFDSYAIVKGKRYDRTGTEFSITSPEKIILQIKDILEKECYVSNKVSIKKYKWTTKAITLRYGKRSDIISLYHYMYDNSTVYLKRKEEKFHHQVLLL